MIKMTEEKKSSQAINYVICGFLCGLLGFALALVLMIGMTPRLDIVEPEPPRCKGVFFGQVVDALTLTPIPNATVKIFDTKHVDSLITTVITNETGYYKTVNITLRWNPHLIVEREGYYTQPLEYRTCSMEQVTHQVREGLFYITPSKLFRIGKKCNLWIIDINGTQIRQNDTIQLKDNRLILDVHIANLEKAAAGSPYFGSELKISVPSDVTVLPEGDSVPSLSYTNPQHTTHFKFDFPPGNYTAKIVVTLNEKGYPRYYEIPIYTWKTLSFYVQKGETE